MQITEQNFDQLLASGQPVVIDFFATWCGPCRRVSPIIDELAEKYAGRVNIGKCDVDAEEGLAARFGVRSIPTIVFLKDGKIVDTQIGAASQSVFEEKIEALLG